MGLDTTLKNRDVIIVEDIVDSGNTIEAILKMLKQEQVKSCKIATMFYKPLAFKKNYPIDYVGIEIENDFIVGYGLDYNGYYRRRFNNMTFLFDYIYKDLVRC